ncbi:hypothetical protein MYX07_02840 [Patescibacteria group bacterium AH-259-L07]|nr:hypothetical protein [Patescibacteria group bacterium AH-259-L07]
MSKKQKVKKLMKFLGIDSKDAPFFQILLERDVAMTKWLKGKETAKEFREIVEKGLERVLRALEDIYADLLTEQGIDELLELHPHLALKRLEEINPEVERHLMVVFEEFSKELDEEAEALEAKINSIQVGEA